MRSGALLPWNNPHSNIRNIGNILRGFL